MEKKLETTILGYIGIIGYILGYSRIWHLCVANVSGILSLGRVFRGAGAVTAKVFEILPRFSQKRPAISYCSRLFKALWISCSQHSTSKAKPFRTLSRTVCVGPFGITSGVLTPVQTNVVVTHHNLKKPFVRDLYRPKETLRVLHVLQKFQSCSKQKCYTSRTTNLAMVLGYTLQTYCSNTMILNRPFNGSPKP